MWILNSDRCWLAYISDIINEKWLAGNYHMDAHYFCKVLCLLPGYNLLFTFSVSSIFSFISQKKAFINIHHWYSFSSFMNCNLFHSVTFSIAFLSLFVFYLHPLPQCIIHPSLPTATILNLLPPPLAEPFFSFLPFLSKGYNWFVFEFCLQLKADIK